LNDGVLEGSPHAIEALREEDYSPTAEGETKEDLIDALHLKLGTGP
jgi:hypothetical protein